MTNKTDDSHTQLKLIGLFVNLNLALAIAISAGLIFYFGVDNIPKSLAIKQRAYAYASFVVFVCWFALKDLKIVSRWIDRGKKR